MTFVHLHVHSHYSLLDGYAKVPALVQAARGLDQDALALTEHGHMASLVEFLDECKKQEIKPLPGVEVYVAAGSRLEKPARDSLDRTHLTALAKNQVGLSNLFKLVSEAHLTGFYYKPRVDKDLLEKHRDGLVILSGCMSGELSQLLLRDDIDGAERVARWYQERFGDDYYVELQSHPSLEFLELLGRASELARKLGIKVVATNDVHYVRKEDAAYQQLLSEIGKERAEGSKDLADYYLKSSAEMAREFLHLPEALRSTLEIAEKVGRIDLPTQVEVPFIPELRGLGPGSDVETLRFRALTNLEARYGCPLPPSYQERFDYELEVIRQTGFASYILLVADICRFARQAGIRFGPRGSAAGSLIIHGLGISEPDPIAHGLIFERFLNPARIEMPDIDLDFQDDRRHEIYEYLVQTYGADQVGAVATYGTLGAKVAIKDVARAQGIDHSLADGLTKRMGNDPKLTLAKAEEIPAIQEMLVDPVVSRLWEATKPLEGIARHVSTHAAGIVLSAGPLTERAPLMRCPKDPDRVQVQYEGDHLQKAGLLKMDVLGLDNLTVLDRALKLIEGRRGERIDVWKLPWDDEATFDLLCQGRVHGVFQLGTGSGRRLTLEVQPRSIADLMALVALNRPGPIDLAPKYAAVKDGREPFEPPHPEIAEIVSETNGVILYQEQVLQIARKIAGFSYGEADVLRKAIGKKIGSLLAEQKEKFVDGAAAHSGLSREEGEGIWAYFEPFANYAFNRAHACSYAYLAYQTAYLKAHYPLEFMCAFLDVARDSQEKLALGIAEASALGIEVLAPSVHHSDVGFTIEREAVRFGLAGVKHVGAGVAREIVANRPYSSLADLVKRGGATRLALEALIKVGATGFATRAAELAVLADTIRAVGRVGRIEDAGQLPLFDLDQTYPQPDDREEAPLGLRLDWERELCGAWVSERPPILPDCDLISDLVVGHEARLVGQVRGLRPLISKSKGERFIAGELVDATGSIKLVCFPKTYRQTEDLWEEGALRILVGRVGEYDGERQLIVDEVEEYVEPPRPDLVLEFGHEDPTPWLDAYATAISCQGDRRVRLVLGDVYRDVTTAAF